jgi:hypothetical protein
MDFIVNRLEASRAFIVVYFRKISYTKYSIGILTVVFTVAVLPLLRYISQLDGGNRSKAAGATFWVLSSIFGMGIIMYPWWLATAKSPIYCTRLVYKGRLICAVVLILAVIQGILSPVYQFDIYDPSITSMAYKVVSSLYTIAILGGLLMVLPYLIRRERLLKSKALYTFAWSFTIIMIASLLLKRWSGFGRVVSFSCIFLVAQFLVVHYFEELNRVKLGKVAIFDEAYLIIAGSYPSDV